MKAGSASLPARRIFGWLSIVMGRVAERRVEREDKRRLFGEHLKDACDTRRPLESTRDIRRPFMMGVVGGCGCCSCIF